MGRLARGPAAWVSAALAALGGTLLEAAFPGLSWWWAAPVAIAVLLLALRHDSIPAGLVTGATFGFTFFLLHVWWADAAVGEPIGWIALAASQAAFVSASGSGCAVPNGCTIAAAGRSSP